jgi:hypothetical protein
MILSSTFVLGLGACTHKPIKSMEGVSPMEHISKPSPQDVLLQEARVESENLRAELGALKILLAKQAGELRSIREQSQSIQHREQDQGIQLQQIRSELLASQAERDQLRKRNVELEGQVAGVPETSQLVSDIQSLSSSFQQIMTNMKQLTADMTLIKREIHISSDKLTPRRTKHTTPQQPLVSRDQQTLDTQGRIVIQPGDTLWELSNKYHVSVAQLKEWNGLDSDLIMTGLRLLVTPPTEQQPAQSNSSVEPPAPQEIPKQVKESLQKMVSPQDNRVESAPEPKHILSLGSPHSNSHESP